MDTPPPRRLALLRVCSLPVEILEPLRAGGALDRLGRALELEAALEAEERALSEDLYRAAGSPEKGDPAAARARLDVVALRRAIHNRRPVAGDLLESARRRLSPELTARVEAHLERRQRLEEALGAYPSAFGTELARTRAALLEIAGRPIFREGMRLVSRSLLERLREMTRGQCRWRHDERHAAAKLTSYAARFTTKTSPNSVFCATALAWIGGEAARVAGDNRPARADFLLSVAEARKITACLAADPEVWPAVVPRPNPTLRSAEGTWTFWRPVTPRDPSDEEVLSRVAGQPVLDLFLEDAARQTLRVEALLASVAERSGYGAEELAGFFRLLLEKGILIAEVEPPYNDRRPLAFLAETVRAAGCAPPWLPEVEAVEREVEELPSLGAEERIAALDRIEERLQALPHVRPLSGDELFRLDVRSALTVELPGRVLDDLAGTVHRYVCWFASLYPERELRAGWARPFLARHPADTDVPLLDVYHGLFDPENRQRSAGFPRPARGREEAFARARAFFAERAREAAARGEDEVRLGDEDWSALLAGAPEPLWWVGVLFQVAAGSAADVTAGRYRLALNAFFSGAGIALTRFAHLLGTRERENPVIKEIRRGYEPLRREGAVFAEITYNHMGRTANAGLRPTILPLEIELPGEKGSPGAEAIPLRDLTVRWDRGEERFVLRWVSRGVEVVPVMSSGVSPEGFVSFLIEIGRGRLQPVAYFPGFEMEGVTRWPRFVSGNVVLFRRRWIFPPERWPKAPEPARERKKPEAAAAGFFLDVTRWRRREGLPRHVFVHTTAEPKPFYLDLESPLFVELLRRLLSGEVPAGALHVTEMLPAPDETWVRDANGRYAAEFLVHLGSGSRP